MKLLEGGPDGVAFSLSQREKAFLERLLSFYPVGPDTRPSLSRGDDPRLADAGALLHEAMREQKRELTEWLKTRLGEGGALARSGTGWRLHLDPGDAERLLQVLNELRVGAWIRLGCPEDLREEAAGASLPEAPFHAIMTLAGQFEMVLLMALDGEGGRRASGAG